MMNTQSCGYTTYQLNT